MIIKIKIGRSFRGVFDYCLQDKKALSHADKMQKHQDDGLLHYKQAEILGYNMCFGKKKDLIRQFREVADTNPNVSKPVQHMTISFDPDDDISTEQMFLIGQEFATSTGFEANQYVVILHHDTKHRHMHIIANRVGYTGKTVSDSNNYFKAMQIARQLEQQYGLRKVPNPRQFQRKEERAVPRFDQRKEQFKVKIRNALITSKDFDEFQQQLKKYKIYVKKGRGVAFEDEDKVYVKGSDITYSKTTIEKILQQPYSRRQLIPLVGGSDSATVLAELKKMEKKEMIRRIVKI